MASRILYALVATAVTAGSAGGLSAGVLALPKGPAREAVERFLVAPGEALMERLDQGALRRLRKKAEGKMEEGKEKVEEAAEALKEKAEALGAEGAAEQLDRLPHLYNVGAWAGAGFILCLLGTLLFGVSSLKSALALGFKVTLALLFLQGALVFGGVLAYQKLKG